MSPTKTDLHAKYEYFRMVLGMTRVLVNQFPEDHLDWRPVPGVRTTAEIVVHMYAFLEEAARTVLHGTHEKVAEPKIHTKGEVLHFMDQQTEKFFELFGQIGDAQLAATVAAYGTSFPGWKFLEFAYDEHWHHRGQLTVYLRGSGVEPVMVYDYGRLAG